VETWTESDYEELSWHDCHIHGLAMIEREYGCGDLVLDIDFITEWEKMDDQALRFHVAPATLVFHEVWDLVIDLDYKTVEAGSAPFSIDGLAREPHANFRSLTQFRYLMDINWPRGSLSFIGHRFTQTLRAEPIVTSSQDLGLNEREGLSIRD
jgi:hypothetical protein